MSLWRRPKGTGSVYLKEGHWWAEPPKMGPRPGWNGRLGPFDFKHLAERALSELLNQLTQRIP